MKKILYSLLMAAMMISTFPLQSSASSALPGGGDPDPTVIRAAIAEYKSLSKQERKLRIKEAKKEWKQYKKKNKNAHPTSVGMAVLIILAILLPPLAIYLHDEELSWKFWVSFPLWFLFIIPGVIFALLVVTDVIQ